MGPETWMRIPQWVDAKRIELERRVDQWPDVNGLIQDVLVAEHGGDETQEFIPDQSKALATLLSEQLRRICFGAEREADNEFYASVGSRSPITDPDRCSPVYLKFISDHVTKSQIRDAIRSMKARGSDAA